MTQKNMYTQVVGKEGTTLLRAYVAGTDTSIDTFEAGKTPDAPNAITITSLDGSKLVTVEYTSKSGATLSGLRVVEGNTPAALTATYPAGSAVTRPLCKMDVDAIQDNIRDLDARTTRTIDGVSFSGTSPISHYAVCTTSAGTAAKIASITGFSLVTGARVLIGFSAANIAQNPTLNVSGTGAKPIKWLGEAVSPDVLKAGGVYELVYDGSAWTLVGDITRMRTPEVHGFLLDNANSDPKKRITYVGASANLTAEERLAIFTEHNRHCIMKAATVVGLCDESDWSKFEDGTDSGLTSGFGLDGNFCQRHDTVWWRVSLYTADVGLVEFTWDNPHDPTWVTAHRYKGTVMTELFTGAFEGTNSTVGSTSNCLRSVYGTEDTFKPLVSITTEAAYSRARNTGTAEGLTEDNNTYSHEQLITYSMLFMQWIWTYGTTDFQTHVARGIVDDSNSAIGRRACGYGMSLTGGMTQGTPASSQAYADNVAAVYGGRVNAHGNTWEFKADCVYKYGKLAMATEGGDHLDITKVTAANFDTLVPESWHIIEGLCLSSGYVKAILFDPYFFAAPKTVGGGATTYMADYTYRNNADTSEAAAAPRCCFIGGSWDDGSHAGPGYVYLVYAVGYSSGYIGARLQAHGLTPVRT